MKPLSFSDRIKAGWSKEQLMSYYVMDEKQYSKVLENLKRIYKNQTSL